MASSFTAFDATSMKVLDVTHPLGIRTGALWLIEGDHQYAYFVFAPTAEAKHIDDLLRGRTLASVMCDGSATNNCVERAGGKRGGCNAHARRGLVEALRCGDRRAVTGLDLFARLFHVDAESLRLGVDTRRSRAEESARKGRWVHPPAVGAAHEISRRSPDGAHQQRGRARPETLGTRSKDLALRGARRERAPRC